MAAGFSKAAALDASAVTLSGLCIIHCLALPLVAAFLPLASVMAEAEWVHKAFVVAAVPISTYAMTQAKPGPERTVFIALALIGLGLLVAAAFVEAFHDAEVLATVAGAAFLAIADLVRWRGHQARRWRPPAIETASASTSVKNAALRTSKNQTEGDDEL